MDPATNQILAAEVSKLEEIRDKVEYKVSRLSPEKITVHIVTTVQDKLKDIIALSDEYGFGMTQLLKNRVSNSQIFRNRFSTDWSKLQAVYSRKMKTQSEVAKI